MNQFIFIFIFILGKTWGTGNKPLNNKGEGSSNPYSTGYNLTGYNLPYSFNVEQGTYNPYGYTGDYLHSYNNNDFNTSQTYQGEGSSTHFGQYNQGIPSGQQINTYSTQLGESRHKNVLPSVIVPPTFSAYNNVAQSSLPNLPPNQLHPYDNQNVDHSTQYPYNSNNISPYYVGGSSTSTVQNNDFQRGIPQEEQLDSLAQFGELGDIFKSKLRYTQDDVVHEQLQGNELSNLNYQQLNQEETLPNVETSNTQVLNDNWLKEKHHLTKSSKGKYNCSACNTHFIIGNALVHINSPKHLQCLKSIEIVENPEISQAYIEKLCNENYINKINTNQYKCMPCNGQNIPFTKRLISHKYSKQHKNALKDYKEKLEKGEIQHLNNYILDENEDWRVRAKNNYMFLDSNEKYLCKVCNKHIKNLKQNVTGHIETEKHKNNIREKEEKDLEQGLNLFNQEMYGNQSQIGESSIQGNNFK
ncbi:hypothetical protein Mgra_00009226 [Meloidogyne graminicola]|uniref:U1-type domain-containing protein n=1 Tax=Meloidogyne graminicola TaxID=189291 RepID=A0A8S9ZDH1_9BILA|nr:hypothetical protein Mgra_00009226 [Meloidogyne graminicola]